MNVCCPPMTWMSNSRMDPEVPDPRASNCSSVNSPHASISSRFAHRLYRKRWASGALTREPLLVRLGEVPDRGREARKCAAHGEADGRAAAGHCPGRTVFLGRDGRLARGTEEVSRRASRGQELLVLAAEGRELQANQSVSARVGRPAETLRAQLGDDGIDDEDRVDGQSARGRSGRREDPDGNEQLTAMRQPVAGEPGPRAADVRLPEGERERLARWIRQEVQIPKRRCEQLSASLCEGRDRIDLATHQRADRSMDDLGGAALRGEKRHVVRSVDVWTRLTRRVLVSGGEDGGLAVAGVEPAARDDRVGAGSQLRTDGPSRAVWGCWNVGGPF